MLTAAVAAGVVLVLGAAVFFGVLALPHYVGYFAPAWDPDGRHVYLLERDTRGVVWGLGWEGFTPPAYAYVLADQLSLKRLDSETGAVETRVAFDASPVVGRVTRSYRGRIFHHLSAQLGPGGGSVAVQARLNVPRVPSSEQWSLTSLWAPGRRANTRWRNAWSAGLPPSDASLRHDVELLTAPGVEGYAAAVLAVDAAGEVRVLIHNDDFTSLYPDGVPAEVIAQRSNREQIERVRDFRYVNRHLVDRFRDEGMSDGEARLRANREMEARGLLPKSPRLVATAASELPADVRVFDISEEYLRVGLFQDIAAALATPGVEVDTSTGTYLKYRDDDLGPRLRAWREAGHDRFGVRYRGRLYLLTVRRFDR